MKCKHRVWRHGELASDVAHAKALQVDEAAMLLDQDIGARQLSCCNFVIEKLSYELELFRCRRGCIGCTGGPASVRAIRHQGNNAGDAPSRGCYRIECNHRRSLTAVVVCVMSSTTPRAQITPVRSTPLL